MTGRDGTNVPQVVVPIGHNRAASSRRNNGTVPICSDVWETAAAQPEHMFRFCVPTRRRDVHVSSVVVT